MYQQVIIIGNVGREVELSYTPTGVAVAKTSIAVNKVTGSGDSRKEKTTWFRCTFWRERAETAHQYLRKGAKVLVVGEVDVNAYIDKNGAAAATLELTANDFKFLDPKPEGEAANTSKPPTGGKRPPAPADDPNDIPF